MINNAVVFFSILALVMAIIAAITATKRQAMAWVTLLIASIVATFVAFDARMGVFSTLVGANYCFIGSLVALFAIFMLLAYIMKTNDKGTASVIAILAAIALIACALFGCNFEKQPEEAPIEEEYLSRMEAYASKITEEDLFRRFGYPRRFKDTSLNYCRKARVKKTGLKDAVTFENGDKEEEMIEEVLSNPIYLQSLNYILQDCEIVGLSNWAKDFTQNDYTNWIASDGYLTKEYHITACRYLAVVLDSEYSEYVERSKNWEAVVHYGLDQEYEMVSTEKSESKLTANWEVYKFANWENEYTDTDDTFIGFSCNDGRWAILEKKAKKANVDAAPAKADIGATAAKTDIGASVPFDWNAFEYFAPEREYHTNGYKSGEIGLQVNRIPDNQGNAPTGGFGSGVDNLSAGTFQPSEPGHVLADSDSNNNTIIYQPSTGSSSMVSGSHRADHTDSNRPSSSSVSKTNTTTYSTTGTTTSSKNTGNTAIDDVNNGTVDGF